MKDVYVLVVACTVILTFCPKGNLHCNLTPQLVPALPGPTIVLLINWLLFQQDLNQ